MNRRLVLFDIDGTLLASRGAGRRAILEAMSHFGTGAVGLDTVRFDGKTDPQIVVELFEAVGADHPTDQERIAGVLERYVKELTRELSRADHTTEVMPGVPLLLERIEAEPGAVLGLLTGNVRDGAWLKLRSANLDPTRFQVGAFGSDHHDRSRLPSIASERAVSHFGYAPRGPELVIVGDTPADMTCGASLGARAIGVATGSYSAAELETAGAWAVFPNLSDVERVWRTIWT